jgi:hypothetical protein
MENHRLQSRRKVLLKKKGIDRKTHHKAESGELWGHRSPQSLFKGQFISCKCKGQEKSRQKDFRRG